MTKKEGVSADNAVTEHAEIDGEAALASFNGEYLSADWSSEDQRRGIEGAVGVIRINLSPKSDHPVGIDTSLESDETGFRVGVMPMLTKEQTEDLIRGLRETLNALEDP